MANKPKKSTNNLQAATTKSSAAAKKGGKDTKQKKKQVAKKATKTTASIKSVRGKKGSTRATGSKSKVSKNQTARAVAAGGPSTFAQVGAALSMNPPPHILVFVPGFLGSKLRDKRTGKIVWLDFSSVPLNPLEWEGWLDDLFQTMLYPNENLEPAGLVEDVMFLPPWIKQEQYGRLLQTFQEWGYAVDSEDPNANELNAYTFAYDWRQDQRISARRLGERLKELRALHPGKQVWLIGHSGGGILSRWLIEKEGGDTLVDRLFLLASPWDGSPKAVYMLFQGMDTMFRVRFNAFGIPERTRAALRSFPAMYQLIPQARSFLKRATGEEVDPFEGSAWLDEERDLALLEDGRKFNKELGNHLSVKDSVAFLGRKLETTIGGVTTFGDGTRWQGIEWSDMELGDGTVPEYSAFFEDARVNVPVVADHGEIYVSPALMDLLRMELIDKFINLQSESINEKKPKTDAALRLKRDFYAPGEPVEVALRLRAVKDGAAVNKATCKARVNWLQALPGTADSEPQELPAIVLKSNPDTPGLYMGSFTAPANEGYYQVETNVKIPRQPEITLRDMFVVEAA